MTIRRPRFCFLSQETFPCDRGHDDRLPLPKVPCANQIVAFQSPGVNGKVSGTGLRLLPVNRWRA
jgi:hypothetical protein